jgi:hypothetical protein
MASGGVRKKAACQRVIAGCRRVIAAAQSPQPSAYLAMWCETADVLRLSSVSMAQITSAMTLIA